MHLRQPIPAPTTAPRSHTGLSRRSRADSVEALRAINLFEACTRPALRRIRRASDVTQVAEGTIIHPGDRLRWVYGLLAGTISIQHDQHAGIANAGEAVGLHAALTGQQPHVTLTALTDSTVIITPQRAFLALSETIPRLGLTIARQIAQAPVQAAIASP